MTTEQKTICNQILDLEQQVKTLGKQIALLRGDLSRTLIESGSFAEEIVMYLRKDKDKNENSLCKRDNYYR